MLATAIAEKGMVLPIIDKDIVTDGKINAFGLGNEFQFGFYMDINKISDSMWGKIHKAIIQAKSEKTAKERRWTSGGYDSIEFEFISLNLSVTESGIDYTIDGLFHDSSDENLEADFHVALDLSRYNGMVKRLVHKYIDDTYFSKF